MKVNCPPEDFLKPTAKWSDRKIDQSILTLPGIPYDIPPALEYDFPDFQPAVQVVALGTNTAPSFYQVQMFTSYKDPQGNIMNNFNYLKEAWESLNKRRGSWYMYAATGEFVEFRLRDFNATSRAAVPLDTAIPYFLLLNLENFFSNSFTYLPSDEIHPVCKHLLTNFFSCL